MKLEEFIEEYEEEMELDEHPANEYSRHWDKERNLWVYDHRMKLGLSDKDRDYIVHHKDGNHHNNSKRNLLRLTRAEHARVEKPALKHDKCKVCGGKHFGRGYCAKHYYLYITKPKRKAMKNAKTKSGASVQAA